MGCVGDCRCVPCWVVVFVGERFMIIWGDELDGASREDLIHIVLQQQELLLQYQELVDGYKAEFAKLREMYE